MIYSAAYAADTMIIASMSTSVLNTVIQKDH